MKKTIALLLAIALILACTPAMAAEWRYESDNLGTSIWLPDSLVVNGEFKAKDDNNTVYIFFSTAEDNTQLTATLTYVPEYKGLETKNLPKTEIEGWKKLFTASYPKHSKSMLIKPVYSSSQRIYRFYGMSKEGNWMLNYSGVKDGLYVSVCCETGRFGFRRNTMVTVFDAFNCCFQLFAQSRGVDFEPFSKDIYEVEIFDLVYDDSPNSIFRSY